MKICKLFSCLLTAVIVLSVNVLTVSAVYYYGDTTPAEEGKTFSSAWETTVFVDAGPQGSQISLPLTIGYDTWAQDEDYVDDCWAPTGYEHYAAVINDDGHTACTNTVNGGFNTGKADIEHTGPNVFYAVMVNIT